MTMNAQSTVQISHQDLEAALMISTTKDQANDKATAPVALSVEDLALVGGGKVNEYECDWRK
jgi:hypothetical protein